MNRVYILIFLAFQFNRCEFLGNKDEVTFQDLFSLIDDINAQDLTTQNFQFRNKGEIQFFSQSHSDLSVKFILKGAYINNENEIDVSNAEIYGGNYFIDCERADSSSLSKIVQRFDAEIISSIIKIDKDKSYFFVRNTFSNVIFICYLDEKSKKVKVPIYQLFIDEKEKNSIRQ